MRKQHGAYLGEIFRGARRLVERLLYFLDVPALELFDGPMAIVGEAIKVPRVIALRLRGEPLKPVGALEVGDHGGDGALGRAALRGADAGKQHGIPGIKLGAFRFVGQALVDAPIPEIIAHRARAVGLRLLARLFISRMRASSPTAGAR